MKKSVISILLCINFSSIICHRSKGSAIVVTRRNSPHTPKELLEIAARIIEAERNAQEVPNKPSLLYEAHQKALADALRPMDPKERAQLGQQLLWFNSFDRRTEPALTQQKSPSRKRPASVPATPAKSSVPPVERSQSAPILK